MALRIEDYALIGDCQTAALVGKDGSIDWLCFPRFDSPACFAALLGTPENGRWHLAPRAEVRSVQRRYVDDTLVLETEFETETGVIAVIDFMPIRDVAPDVVRIVEGRRGAVEVRSELVIRFDYGSVVPWVRRDDGGITAVAGPDALHLRTSVETHGENMTTVGDFTVREGERVPFVLTWHRSFDPDPKPVDPEAALGDTLDWWREWSGRCSYQRMSRELVMRFAHHLEGPDVSAERRDRGGPDDVAARVSRRRAELGLSLLLASGRDTHAAFARQRRVHR